MMKNKNIIPKAKIVKQKQVTVQNKFITSYRKWLEFSIIFILVFITYGNSLKNNYNIDGAYVISLDEGNLQTEKGISAIPEIFSSKYNEGLGVTYGYRPFGKVTMAIEYSLWRNNPQSSNFLNLLLSKALFFKQKQKKDQKYLTNRI